MRTGTLTSPKEMVPDQIARGTEDLVPRTVTALTHPYPPRRFGRFSYMASILIDEALDAIASEEVAVQMWRREQFGRLGFDAVIARLLAESTADLGLARRLSRAGCPVALAFRILA
jgi:hypothetical protein